MSEELSAAEASVQTSQFVMYVSLGGEKKIARFRVNSETGELKSQEPLDVEGAPGPMAVGPKREFLYVAIRSTGSVATMRIDSKSGKLTQIATTPVVANPVYLSLDKTGKFLLTAYYGAGKAAIFPIKADRTVGKKAVVIHTTDKNPHSILADPTNRFVYTPNTGADKILQFNFDEKTGKMQPAPIAEIATDPGTGPRHFWFHPTKNYVYFVNEKGLSVTAFKLDKKTGTPKAIQTISTHPKNFDSSKGGFSCADIEIVPSGKFLYASNRGHDSIAGFAIDAKTGRLTSLGQFATEKTPRSFNIDPTGNFLFAAGQSSGTLAAYRINSATGKLSKLAVYEVGKGPSWVQVVRMAD